VSGNKVVDTVGKGVMLRGFNLLTSQARTEEDYVRLRSWNVTALRFQVRWDWLEPQPNEYSETYLKTIDSEIALAKKY